MEAPEGTLLGDFSARRLQLSWPGGSAELRGLRAQEADLEQVFDVPSQEVITKDNAVVKVDGVVFFQVLDAAKAAYEVSNLEIASIALVQTNIRTVIGSMDLDESLSQRETINAQLLSVVDQATNPWGIKVNRIELKDIQPPRDAVFDDLARELREGLICPVLLGCATLVVGVLLVRYAWLQRTGRAGSDVA